MDKPAWLSDEHFDEALIQCVDGVVNNLHGACRTTEAALLVERLHQICVEWLMQKFEKHDATQEEESNGPGQQTSDPRNNETGRDQL